MLEEVEVAATRNPSSERGAERTGALVGALSGIGFMLLGLGATFLYTQPPRIDSTPATMLQWAQTHRTGIEAGMIVQVFASAFFLPFAVGLKRRLDRAGDDFSGSVAYASGIGYSATIGLGGLPLATLTFMDGQPGGITDGNMVRFLVDSYQIIYAPATLLIGLLLVVTGGSALRTKVFSTWIGWFSIAMGLIAAVETVPIMINSSFHPGPWRVVGWTATVGSLLVILILCIEMLRRPEVTGPA